MKTEKKTCPSYYRIKEDIKSKIQNGELKPGAVLPTENQLCEEYGASRVTIRRAVNELIGESVLDRGFGKTATVKCENVPRSLNRLGGLHEELEKAGIKCSSFILSSAVMDAPAEIAAHMGLGRNEKVLKIERLRYANGQSLCYQVLYLKYELCEKLDVKGLASASLYEVLERDFDVKIDTATQTISAGDGTYPDCGTSGAPGTDLYAAGEPNRIYGYRGLYRIFGKCLCFQQIYTYNDIETIDIQN